MQKQKNLELITYDEKYMTIKMSYTGESLYRKFNLPINYKEQLFNIFTNFTENKIFYKEFKLENITVNNKGEITLIDFGLAEDLDNRLNNNENYEFFCKILDLLYEKFKNIDDEIEKIILYNKLMININFKN